MGILSGNIDDILIIYVKDMIKDVRLYDFRFMEQYTELRSEIMDENIEVVMNQDRFAEKYCKSRGQIAEIRCIQTKNNGRICIDIFRRFMSGSKIIEGKIEFIVEDQQIFEMFKDWNNH